MNAIEAQIQDRIATFVKELDALVRRSTLEALRGVLDASSAPMRRGRGPGRPKGSGGGRSSGDVESAGNSILTYVQANDGQGVGEIAAGAGVAPKLAKKVIAQLLASGSLKKTGQKRGTKYHVGSGKAPARLGKKGKRGKRRGRKAKAA